MTVENQLDKQWTTKQLLEFHDIVCARAKSIMAKKNHDYAGGGGLDPFANFKASATVTGDHPVKGLITRMVDKMRRVNTFIEQGELKVPGETVYDAFEDSINYNILGDALMYEMAGVSFDEWKEKYAT